MTGEGTVVRLLTLNALFKGDVRLRLRALAELLEQGGHDVVCLQEVMYRANVRLLQRLVPTLPHRVSSGAVLLEGGLVILSRWPVTRSRFVRYPMLAPVRTELLMRKGAQVAVVRTPGGELAVVNTHLSANRDDDWSPGNRYTRIEQAELRHLAGVLGGVDPALPVVATGDFNVPRDSPVLAEFVAAAGLRDLMAGDTGPTYRPTPQFPAPPAFDHVLVRPAPGRELDGRARLVFQDEVPLADGRRSYLSDHFGIATDLVLPVGGR
ncbi:endonuclease/exonuclease/phosphatase family protein [Dactylosporangium fulvum]|uniref:Endonuclease/exonuclease/phosphatase family protein n=1 Tax=Dactylosporangium fulvum TaxID=53359 RepID=A0ABY5VR29_9ACTN|nr:endonuclease/exonuclease/phosphatase family protein [Dactylosporangium fulvum]UWP79549.1 endonuclease/exonuclease/phosphatase family protein [Dactylosporangium fulvum]